MVKTTPINEKQRKLLTIRQLEQQITVLQREIENGRGALREMLMTTGSLERLSKDKGENNALIPLGSGAFVNAKIPELNKILVEVGAGVVVEKTTEEAITLINEKKEKLSNNLKKANMDLNNLSNEHNKIVKEIYDQDLRK